jgi:hypothetical protein
LSVILDEWLLAVALIFLFILGALAAGLIVADVTGRDQAGNSVPRGEAEERARSLLKEWLSPSQLARYATDGLFEVTGCHTGKRYRIRHDRQMNIDELDERGVRVAVLCFGPTGQLPVSDIMLAQKIALETDEQAALVIANRNSG